MKTRYLERKKERKGERERERERDNENKNRERKKKKGKPWMKMRQIDQDKNEVTKGGDTERVRDEREIEQ